MSSELYKHIETSIKKKENLLNAEVISFPNDKKINITQNFQNQKIESWRLTDKSNVDQLRAVVGVCFTFGALILMGLYSSFI